MPASRTSSLPDLHLDLRDSPLVFAAAPAWLLTIAVVLLCGTALSWPWRLASLTLLAPAAATLVVGRRRRRRGLELVHLCWAADGRWFGWNGAGERCQLRLTPVSALLGRWMLLVLREAGHRHWVPISAGRVGERAFRELALRFELDRHGPRDGSC